MSTLWTNSQGQIIKDPDTGQLLICDDCPCGGCTNLPTTLLVTHFNGTLFSPTIVDQGLGPRPQCANEFFESTCFWWGIIPGGTRSGQWMTLVGYHCFGGGLPCTSFSFVWTIAIVGTDPNQCLTQDSWSTPFTPFGQFPTDPRGLEYGGGSVFVT